MTDDLKAYLQGRTGTGPVLDNTYQLGFELLDTCGPRWIEATLKTLRQVVNEAADRDDRDSDMLLRFFAALGLIATLEKLRETV